MIYNKAVPRIIKKLTDGDEEGKTLKNYQEKVLSRGSKGERNLTNRIGRSQHRTFDIYKKVSDRISSGVR